MMSVTYRTVTVIWIDFPDQRTVGKRIPVLFGADLAGTTVVDNRGQGSLSGGVELRSAVGDRLGGLARLLQSGMPASHPSTPPPSGFSATLKLRSYSICFLLRCEWCVDW